MASELVHAAKKSQKGRKIGGNQDKCARYRLRVGKPRGRGVPGNKSGRNFVPVKGWKVRVAP